MSQNNFRWRRSQIKANFLLAPYLFFYRPGTPAFWAEAERKPSRKRYDSALVESWKADMEVILIFSGLFSASLTAFIIESYGNLTPDRGDMTVALLSQVSLQLSAHFNGSQLALPPPEPFRVPISSLVCKGSVRVRGDRIKFHKIGCQHRKPTPRQMHEVLPSLLRPIPLYDTEVRRLDRPPDLRRLDTDGGVADATP
ncbi:hypothetical protein B0H11DRAFT_1929473 [Mycena galericulata]|nr:hypothetical protein B0H11DRAFT_1929473 [Mycena galericulata]